MASTRTLGQLFRALGSQDLRTASALARSIAEDEERKGHRSAAALLKGALLRNPPAVQLSGPLFDVTSALIPERPGPQLHDVTLTLAARDQLSDLIAEWRFRDELERNSVPRRTKLVFSGPPGCGKTLTARSLGTELGLPVLTVRFSNLVGAYLGQTGANVRSVFAFAEGNACILLLDEFDAIGRTRGRSTDIGELDRIVISLLQELDHTMPAGLVVAATNSPESLDRALWRRFDAHVQFPLPTRRRLEQFVATKLRERHTKRNRAVLSRAAKSFADAERWVLDLQRQQLLRRLKHTNGAAR